MRTRDVVDKAVLRGDPRHDASDPPPEPLAGDEQPAAEIPAAQVAPDAVTRHAVPPRPPPDPRLESLEPLIASGDWERTVAALRAGGPVEQLPPHLGLLYAVARHEHEAAPGIDPRDMTQLAIRSMAALLGVEPGSELALVLAKRLLRKNPVSWRKAQAPPARVSLVIVAVALVLGGVVGWLVTFGHLRFSFLTFP